MVKSPARPVWEGAFCKAYRSHIWPRTINTDYSLTEGGLHKIWIRLEPSPYCLPRNSGFHVLSFLSESQHQSPNTFPPTRWFPTTLRHKRWCFLAMEEPNPTAGIPHRLSWEGQPRTRCVLNFLSISLPPVIRCVSSAHGANFVFPAREHTRLPRRGRRWWEHLQEAGQRAEDPGPHPHHHHRHERPGCPPGRRLRSGAVLCLLAQRDVRTKLICPGEL